MPRIISAWIAAALSLPLWAATALAQPTLSSISPQAVAPGKTIDLTLNGTKLDDPLTVWTSFPAKVELVPDPAKGRAKIVCKITLEADVPVGVGGILIATPEGVTDPMLLVVDDLPSVADAGPNRALAAAQEVTLPVAIDGVAAAAGSCFYKFTAKAGQRVAIEVLARRLASPLDPVLWLRDANGRELLTADDDPGLGADCRFAHTFAADGVYIVELRDNAFAGGGRFRLRIGDFPLVSAPFPLGGQLGQPAKFEVAGTSVAGVAPIAANVPATASKRMGLSVKLPGGLSSGLATFAVSNLPEALEVEPNDTPETATKVTLPCAVSGRLHVEKDKDHFQFEAKKGQRLTFKSGARSFGSPTFVFMRLLKVGGAQVAETPVTEAEEESLTHVFAEDGMYALVVEDLLRRGGPDHVYRVEIEAAPGFSLALKADPAARYKYVATKTGGTFSLDLICARAGYDGPITLSVEGPAGPLPAINNVIPDKGVAAKLIVNAPAGLSEGQLQLLRVVGKATFEGREVAVAANSAALLKLKMPQLSYPPVWLDGSVVLGLVPDTEPYYTMAPEQPESFFPRVLGQTQVNIAFERKNAEFKDALLVTQVEGLPAGFTAEVKRNGNGPKEQYQVIVKGPKDAPDGKHVIRLVSYGEFKGVGLKTVTADIPVTVVTPLTISVAAAGPIVQGQAQKVKITAARFTQGAGAEKQPIVIKWKKVPAGIKPSADVTIPADKDDIEVELSAAADAKEGKFDELIVTATTKFQGQDLAVDSPAGSLEIKKP